MERAEASPAEPAPVGAIHNTESNGRLDLVIYPDGILTVPGTYRGVALRGAGVGMVGAGGAVGAGSGATVGVAGARGYEDKR
jgi:hypothetical protein